MDTERFPPLPEEAMSARQRAVRDAILGGPRGSLRGPFRALLRSPDLADRVQRLGEYVRFGGALPAKLTELAILLTARRWTAQFEWYAHRRLALAAGLSPAVADRIAEGARPEGMSTDEALVHDAARALLDEGQLSDALFDALAARFGERGVVDLVGTVGYYTLISFVLNVNRTTLPEGEAGLKPLGMSWQKITIS